MIIAQYKTRVSLELEVNEAEDLIKLLILGREHISDKKIISFCESLTKGLTGILEWMEGKKECQQ